MKKSKFHFLKVRWLKKYFKKRGAAKGIISLALWSFFALAVFMIILAAIYAKDLPNPGKLADYRVSESTKIYDRTGTIVLYDIHGEEKRTIIPFDQIPDYVKEATLVTEDVNFYHHFGLDFKGILRAVWSDIAGRSLSQGGSTITQQFIKKTFLSPEKTFSRKIKEAILAIELEILYPKDKIFEGYLNQIPYGSNAYGIEAAAQTFFRKPAKDLTLAESALLASLPQAPTYYSPYGSHLDDLNARQKYVLDRMAKFGYITQEEAEKATTENLSFSPIKTSIKAPHFVMYVRELLEEKYGEDYIEKSGLKVYTTLDWDLQQIAEEVINKGVKSNEKKYRSFNGALVAADPKTGQILAMVGSKDYFAEPLPQTCSPGSNCKFEPNVNVAIRDRQPGSSFKPFAYATAIEKGYPSQTILFDLPTEFNASCPASGGYDSFEGNKCYNPQNYDGRFRGPVTMRQALAQSLNIPSVKMLYLAGVNDTINLAQDMGITTLKDRKRYGLALVLGGGEVKLVDMVAAYGVFANDGIQEQKTPILKIENADGKVLEEWKEKSEKIIDPQVARTISDILSDNSARAPVFGSASPLYLGVRPAAVKTGTTQEYRDAWTIGYTPSLVAGVWTGNNDNTPMTKEGAGMAAAAPLWNEFIKKAYEIKANSQTLLENNSPFKEQKEQIDSPSLPSGFSGFSLSEQIEEFPKPDPLTSSKSILNGQAFSEKIFKIDKVSGKLAIDSTPPDLIEEKSYKEAHCILFYVEKDSPLGNAPANPNNDPQFANWEAPVLSWAKENSQGGNEQPPTEYDDIHTPANQPQVTIIFPSANSIVRSRFFPISAQVSALLGIKQVDFFLDDAFIGSDISEPYELSFPAPSNFSFGEHTLKVRAYDQALNREEEEITFNFSPSF